MPSAEMVDVPVLIIGAGPVGLSASLLLSDLGIDSLLVERNEETSTHPKAHVVNTRTMEVFRSLGVHEAVEEQAIGLEAMRHVRWVRSLAGEEVGHLDRDRTRAGVSPHVAQSCPQDRVEEILLAATRERRGLVEFGAELVDISQNPEGVEATIRSATGTRTVRADYLIGSDGATSTVRELLGVAMDGPDDIATVIGTYFHADLRHLVETRPSVLYWVMNSSAPGTFIALDGVERWMFHIGMVAGPDVGFGEAEAIAKLRVAIGDPDVEIDIRSIRPWRMTAQLAERYRVGRVFLAGDAAHRFPPTGGLGMNTGIQDVHNLAWKLAAVAARISPEGLLETYEEERRPVGDAVRRFSLDNFTRGGRALGPGAVETVAALEAGGAEAEAARVALQADIDANRSHFGGLGRDLGFVYETGALLPERTTAESADSSTEFIPDASPGSRAPHVWLRDREGERRSVIDLPGGHFVAVRTGPGEAGGVARVEVESMQAIPGCIYPDRSGTYVDSAGSLAEIYGLEQGGCVLIRPDGHVAWRSRHAPSEEALDHAVAVASGRNPTP